MPFQTSKGGRRLAATLLLGLVAGAVSCAAPLIGYRLPSPSVTAASGHCATAALMGMLEMYQRPYDKDSIDEDLYIPALGGSLGALISAVATERGIELEAATGSWPQIEEWVKAGRPPILLLGPPEAGTTGHVILISGIGRGAHYVQVTDSDGSIGWRKCHALTAAWSQTGFSVLVPKESLFTDGKHPIKQTQAGGR